MKFDNHPETGFWRAVTTGMTIGLLWLYAIQCDASLGQPVASTVVVVAILWRSLDVICQKNIQIARHRRRIQDLEESLK